MGVAVFDPTAFKARYPEFAAVNNTYLGELFGDAGLFLNNTDSSIVQDVPTRLRLLNMIVAHLCKLAPPAAGAGVGGQDLVGRISNATQGSVSVATEFMAQSQSQAFWIQTQYGAQYWQATTNLRRARYVAAPPRNLGVPGGALGRRFY